MNTLSSPPREAVAQAGSSRVAVILDAVIGD